MTTQLEEGTKVVEDLESLLQSKDARHDALTQALDRARHDLAAAHEKYEKLLLKTAVTAAAPSVEGGDGSLTLSGLNESEGEGVGAFRLPPSAGIMRQGGGGSNRSTPVNGYVQRPSPLLLGSGYFLSFPLFRVTAYTKILIRMIG